MKTFIWWFQYLWYHIRWNRRVAMFCDRIHRKRQFFAMVKRMNAKQHSTSRALDIMNRFLRMERFKQKLEDRDSRIRINNMIVELSEKWGVPQWEVREKIKRDFHLNI